MLPPLRMTMATMIVRPFRLHQSAYTVKHASPKRPITYRTTGQNQTPTMTVKNSPCTLTHRGGACMHDTHMEGAIACYLYRRRDLTPPCLSVNCHNHSRMNLLHIIDPSLNITVFLARTWVPGSCCAGMFVRHVPHAERVYFNAQVT